MKTMSDLFRDSSWMESVLAAGRIGLWILHFNPDTQSGQMLGNAAMLDLVGLRLQPAPENFYKYWFARIEKGSKATVLHTIHEIINTGKHREVEYVWLHPERGYTFMRAGGSIMHDTSAESSGLFIPGYQQDITELETIRQQLKSSLEKLENMSELNGQLVQLNEEYRTLAYIDMLTGLPNRRAFFEYGTKLILTLHQDASACLIMADIDHFKVINDTYSHPRGDDVLREVASRLQAMLRKSEICGRIGGEEFAILLACNLQQAGKIAERIRSFCAQTPIDTVVGGIPVTVSFGVAEMRKDTGADPAAMLQEVLQRADKALYRAKQTGRNRVCLDET